MNEQQAEQMRHGAGFIAALDQSGGSTPKALAGYGVGPERYSNDAEMFELVHAMRTRVITSKSFTSERIIGAILFERTMDGQIEGRPTAEYLWEVKHVVPFLKVDKGLADEEHHAKVMKPIPDLDALLARLGGLGARLSYVGRVDLFGMGEWRLHVDTSAPLAAHPTSGQVIRFQVCDARPDAQIGIDELADEGLSHRGVRLLQRRPMRRVERARVIACTSAPGLVEDLARAGAVVFLDLSSGDAAGIVSAATSRTGVTLVATCDEASASLVSTVASVLPSPAPGVPAILRAGSRDDLDVLAVARACAPLFVPQPGGVEAAPTLARMLRDGAHDALASCASAPLPPGGDPEGIAEALAEASRSGGDSWRLLISRDDDGPYTVATVRQLLSTRDASSTIDLETWDGGQSGPSLVAGCAS